MLKNPKFWGSIIAVGLAVAGLVLGVDFKKIVCEAPEAASIVK